VAIRWRIGIAGVLRGARLANLKGVIRVAGIVAATLTLLWAASAQALTLEQVGEFDQPIYVTSDPGDPDRLLVAEREGTIRLVEDGGPPSPFADLSGLVECGGGCQGERGLMSIALSPTFDSDGRVFAFYANDVDGALHVVELESTDPGHDEASFDRDVLTIPHPGQTNHNGGQLQFGPEGDLFASTGDGGGQNSVLEHAQELGDPLGKILRIDPDSSGEFDVWSLGLRNPFRFSFDRATSDMVIGDVGQGAREEIDFAPSPLSGVLAGGQGLNYGWNCREGLLPGPATEPECATLPPSAFADPVFDYPQSPDPDFGGERCAITGGYVVRDPGLGRLYGNYVYADYCAGAIRSLRLPAKGGEAASGECSLGLKVDNPVSFGEDAAGQLYVVEQDGPIYRFEGLPPANCPVPLPQPPPRAGPNLAPTFIGIKAQRRRVERGRTAVLTVWVSPCQGRRGDTVALLRNGRRNGAKFLSRACTARFLRRVHRNTAFTAATFADQEYAAGDSRHLRIRIVPRHRARPR
jgi:glucose/sorbosone dehydrogenase